MERIIYSSVKPIQVSLSKNIIVIVDHQIKSVHKTVGWVETVWSDSCGIGNLLLGWITYLVHTVVLKTRGCSEDERSCTLSVELDSTILNPVLGRSVSGPSEAFVGKMSLLIKHTGEPLTINSFQMILNAGDSSLSVCLVSTEGINWADWLYCKS